MTMAAVNVRIPVGTSVQVRITEKLSSETANVGDVFHGSLAVPVVANGRTLFPKGAIVTGEVVNVERSGRLSTPGELHLNLRTIRTGGRTYPVSVQTVVIKGEPHTKSNVTKIGGGTAFGALIGAIAGGGKGAAIGAGVGAAAGTGVAAGTGKKPAEVESETVLAWLAQGAPPVVSTQRQDSGQYSAEPEREAEDHHDNRRYSRDDDRDDRDQDYDARQPMGFSDRDRQIIGDCFVNDRAGLPPGLAKKDRLPPGLERQLQRNGTLPPGLQKRAQRLPGSCEARLPPLPNDWVRVVVSGRVILLNSRERIVDLFWLDSN
jgi:outer membrane lipoprotein SlyB